MIGVKILILFVSGLKGQFPRAGNTQFIPNDIVYNAMKRGSGRYLENEPLISGIDIARGGDDNCMITFRQGKDAKSKKAYKISGEKSRDSMVVISKITLILNLIKPDVTFLDETGIGDPILDRLVQLGYNIIGVHFGAKAIDEKHFKNRTSEMAYNLREWILSGGSLPNSPKLEEELTTRDFTHDDKGTFSSRIKKRYEKKNWLFSRLGGFNLFNICTTRS